MTEAPEQAAPYTRATEALASAGVVHTVIQHGPVASLDEAAAARGMLSRQVVKTLVVRRGEGDFLLVLVPGDRQISWPKLRSLLGVSRLSMPDAATAKDVTGYERGTITPFGALGPSEGRSWPVIADALILERAEAVSIGGGAHGVSATLEAKALIAATRALVADVTDPL
ncbi:aminoacyl-tRNA deacylase [Demequina capsici]|uniref:YbaK/EbsC family protein n=1 Tax=Demequina capsici TaxID=3075620 RepID=A0AA96JCC0_9MICO|nr:YbaK/EbsC family protein [Demequina sp. OYTSA14]WNM23489.1 YbaK/EbsC family protein [Demequina sp. OYTSA14]